MNIANGYPPPKSRGLYNHLPTLTLLSSLLIVFIIKYVIVSDYRDMGCDIANYLSTMHTVFGHDPNGLGLLRPPLIALPLKAFTLVFGDLTGVKLLGITLSVSIGIPFYLLARRVSHPWIAAAMSIVFVLTPAYSDMLSWGYITMTGLLFILLTLHFFIQVIEKPSKPNVVLTGVFASLIVGFHQLSLAFFIPLFFLVTVAMLLLNWQESRERFVPAFVAITIGILLSVPYIPLYLGFLEMQPSISAGVPFSATPYYFIWTVAMILSLPLVWLILRWIWRRDRSTAIVIAVLFLYSSALLLFVLPSPFAELNRRAHYFLYAAIWLLVSAFLSHLWSLQATLSQALRRSILKAGVLTLLVALICSTLITSQLTLHHGLESYGYLDRTRWETVSWIRDHTSSETSVVAYPEALGWWIEAEAGKQAVSVIDRNTAPLEPLRERSLIADLILSRNQGLENGNLRLATPYPYDGVPGTPAFGVFAGGCYHDLLMFDDSQTYVEGINSSRTALDGVQREMTVIGDSSGRTMTTSYQIDSMEVVQTVELQRGSQASTVRYGIRSDGGALSKFEVPLFFGFEPRSVSFDPDQCHIEVVQDLQTSSGQLGVTTEIDISSNGATITEMAHHQDGRLDLCFNLQDGGATIDVRLAVTDPKSQNDADVEHYQVPDIIAENSIGYLAVDYAPNPHLVSGLPWGIEQWLGKCPYYELVYPEGGDANVKVYRVQALALS